MTDTNHIEQRARELLGDVIGYDLRRSLDTDSMTVTIDDALVAISAALSARASAGEGVPEITPALAGWFIAALGDIPDDYQRITTEQVMEALRANVEHFTADPQPAQAGASGGGGHEKMAAYLTQAIKDSEAGKTVYVRLTPGEVEECVTLLRTPASPAMGSGSEASIGAAFLSVLGDPSVRWRETGAQPFIDRVAQKAATPQPAAAQGGHAEKVLVEYVRICISEHDERSTKEDRIDAMRRAMLAAAPQPQERDSRDMVRTEITREDFGPAGEPGDTNYQRWLDQSRTTQNDDPESLDILEGVLELHYPRAKKHIQMIRDYIAELRTTRPTPEARDAEDLKKLQRFAAAVMGDEIGDVDGFDLQDIAERCGLLTPTEVTESCCEESCRCAEYGDFPLTCYRHSATLIRAYKAEAALALPAQGENNDG